MRSQEAKYGSFQAKGMGCQDQAQIQDLFQSWGEGGLR